MDAIVEGRIVTERCMVSAGTPSHATRQSQLAMSSAELYCDRGIRLRDRPSLLPDPMTVSSKENERNYWAPLPY
jgi:hypothetical protein